MPKKSKPPKPSAQPVPNRKTVFVKPLGGTPCLYSNHIQLGQTVFDMRIVFGLITDVNEEKVEVTQQAQVNLSWLEAKALKEFLAAYIAQYEKINGELKTEFEQVSNPVVPQIPRIIPAKS